MGSGPHDDDFEGLSTTTSARFDASAGGAATFDLAVVEGNDLGARLRIGGDEPSPIFVGQSASCALRLTDREVSRRHASFELSGARLRITDLESKNGTRIDQLAIVSAYLVGGEQIRVGRTVIEVSVSRPTTVPSISSATRFGRTVGASKEMRRLYPLCARLAASDVPIVIEGETGTGKEVLAESIHGKSARAARPFVVFDCTSVAPNLVESELFGHERGAFTGAVSGRKGVFEAAEGGTVLIDEIGDLDLALQPKLLRVVEKSEFRRVGGTQPVRTDVRIIAATRRDLDREVAAGRFRDDLFHRLAVARIDLPPLRARRGDVPVLARHFASELVSRDCTLPSDLLARWEGEPWPGNLRELRNAVARYLALGELDHLQRRASSPPVHVERLVDDILELDLAYPVARDRLVEGFARRYVERALNAHGGDVTKAAAASGIGRRYFDAIRARTRK